MKEDAPGRTEAGNEVQDAMLGDGEAVHVVSGGGDPGDRLPVDLVSECVTESRYQLGRRQFETGAIAVSALLYGESRVSSTSRHRKLSAATALS